MFRYIALRAGVAVATVSALVLSAFAQQTRSYPEPSAWSSYPQTNFSGYAVTPDMAVEARDRSPDMVTPTAYVPYANPVAPAGYMGAGYARNPAYAYAPSAAARPAAYAPYPGPAPTGGYALNPGYAYAPQAVAQPVASVPYSGPAPVSGYAAANPGYGYAPPVAAAPAVYGQRPAAVGNQARASYTPNPGFAPAAGGRPATGYRIAQNGPITGYGSVPTYAGPSPAGIGNGIAPVPAPSAGMVSSNCPPYGGGPGGCVGAEMGMGVGGYGMWGFGRRACGLVQHYAYYPPMHGYYYFHPYHHEHVPMQQAFASSFGLDPRNPYSNDFFKAIYAEYRASQREPAPTIEEIPHPLPPVTSTR